jgi:hypothetical protein
MHLSILLTLFFFVRKLTVDCNASFLIFNFILLYLVLLIAGYASLFGQCSLGVVSFQLCFMSIQFALQFVFGLYLAKFFFKSVVFLVIPSSKNSVLIFLFVCLFCSYSVLYNWFFLHLSPLSLCQFERFFPPPFRF